jgi:hypothetical protein
MTAISHLLNGCKNRSSLQAGDRPRSKFEDFRSSPLQCKQCLKSKQFSLLLKRAQQAESLANDYGEWEPEDPEVAEAREQEILKRIRDKK